jgi:hypothetical protein
MQIVNQHPAMNIPFFLTHENATAGSALPMAFGIS